MMGIGKDKLSFVVLSLFATLVGCSSSPPVINSDGPLPRQNSYQFNQFKTSFDLANSLALDVAHGTRSNDDKQIQAAYTQMVIDGFGLGDANCADFFREAGNNQKWALFSRDLVAAAGTLATAVTAAANAPSGLITAFSITTATAYNSLDIYQRNFLFGADNIESVKVLVEKALAAHTEATLQTSSDKTKTSWIGFGEAASAIMDHQEICFPASILLLSRTAIKNADVNPVSTGGRKFSVSVAPPVGAQIKQLEKITPNTKPPVRATVITDIIPAEILARETALKRFVKKLAAGVTPDTIKDSDLRRVAVTLSAPISDDVGEQRDNIISFITVSVNGKDPEKSQAAMDSISKKLADAGIHETF